MKISMYTLIAMWLWCVAAAGETIPLVTTPELLKENAQTATLATPCNWDKNLDTVQVMGFYGTSGSGTQQEVLLEPVAKAMIGAYLQVVLKENVYMYEQKPLHHVNVLINTTEKTCPGGFGFSPGNFVK